MASHSSERFAAIVDQCQTILVGKRFQFVPGGRVTKHVDHHDRFRAVGAPAFEFLGVEVVGVRRDVDKHRFEPLVEQDIHARRKGEGGYKHLVSGGESQRADNQVQGRRPGIDRDGVLDPHVFGHRLLKGDDLWAEGEAATVEHV